MKPVTHARPSASAQDGGHRGSTDAPARRVFLRSREVPGLLVGVLLADAVSQRRVLGARRGGRVGAVLGLAALWVASPGWSAAAGLAVLHIAITLGLGLADRATSIRAYQRLRLSLWAGVSPLLLASTLRLVWPDSVLPALLGLVVAQLILYRGLRRGLA